MPPCLNNLNFIWDDLMKEYLKSSYLWIIDEFEVCKIFKKNSMYTYFLYKIYSKKKSGKLL